MAARLPASDDAPLDADETLGRFLEHAVGLGLDPYPAQDEALLELWGGRHVVLATPTGSGKSLVALGLHFKALCEGRRSFYTAPVKALVNEKFFALCDAFGPERVGMLTGDASINHGAPVICCTAEVLANMALRQGEGLEAPYVVMDEFHYYADRERGAAWQVPLLTLRETSFLLMSATLGDMTGIARRLRERTGREVALVESDQRPVPLDYEYRETPIHETVEALLAERRSPVYIVHFTQRECAEQAQGLTSAKLLNREEKRCVAEGVAGFRFDTPYGKSLQRFVRHGIGVHHAGLLPKYRLLVEQLAQQGLLKVVCGTDTLGVGVNIPIRTVLFSGLSKFDGEKVGILRVRDFKQIAGRAGRKGFDDRGSVVCQAPQHVIVNKRRAGRGAGTRKKPQPRKAAPRGFVAWNRDTFRRLIERPPETLSSRFDVTHGMLVNVMQRPGARESRSGGYRGVLDLIDRCHEDARGRSRLRRRSAALFRSLRQAGVIKRVYDADAGCYRVRVDEDLQWDFSLHHTLSLYLVEALEVLDPSAEEYPLEVLTLVESVLEDPALVLRAQVSQQKQKLLARLKAAGVPYEERIRRLDEITHPKPNADFIYATFDIFASKHPWVGHENIRPKSVAREMFESYLSFEDYVRRYGLQRSEGLLLRYLGQVHNTLGQSVPAKAKTTAVYDAIAFFRTLVAEVDTSLLDEWESMRHPELRRAARVDESPRRPKFDPALHPKAFAARVRAEFHRLLRALAREEYAEAVRCVRPSEDDPWDAERFEQALSPFLEEYGRIVFEPRARGSQHTHIKDVGGRSWDVTQVLIDPQDDNLWCLEGRVELDADELPDGPLIALRRIGT
ncbi:MAG: DUF3516 domain-containing protein [Deltaproteobacteria bacterium]|nr:MAG: DUF3516 domain-containing protein [Deltaproteobacteria bacterium]